MDLGKRQDVDRASCAGGEMGSRREGADVRVMRVVMRRSLLTGVATRADDQLHRAFGRTNRDGNARGAGGSGHPAVRQQRSQHHRCERKLNPGKA